MILKITKKTMVTHLNPECIPDGAITAPKLVMDSIVTESSTNPVQSGAVKTYVDNIMGDIDTILTNIIGS